MKSKKDIDNNSNNNNNNNNNTKNKNNNKTDKKKKYKNFKKYSLCFPFHIDIKIINDQKIILFLINTIQNLITQKQNNNNTFLFGLNSTLNCIQKNKKEEKLIFVFYKKQMETLYDLMLFRAKFNKNYCIYFIDEDWQKKFLDIFKLKKLLSFIYLKDNTNDNIFNDIKNKLENYNINNDSNMVISNNVIQEITIESKK